METPNYEDFQTGREAQADANLMVKFFLKEREDKQASLDEGRPIFKEVEYMEIRIAGKRDAQVCRPATPADKQRFPRHYDMFKRRVEMPTEGTPLAEWPQISRTMVEELSFMQIKTVEQLVSVSDGDVSRIHGGLTLKQKATEFLEFADQGKLVAEKQALEAKAAAQDAQLADQAKQLAELQATLKFLMDNQNSKPAPIAEEAPAPDVKPTRGSRRGATPTKD